MTSTFQEVKIKKKKITLDGSTGIFFREAPNGLIAYFINYEGEELAQGIAQEYDEFVENMKLFGLIPEFIMYENTKNPESIEVFIPMGKDKIGTKNLKVKREDLKHTLLSAIFMIHFIKPAAMIYDHDQQHQTFQLYPLT